MLALNRSLLNREYNLMNARKTLASIISMCSLHVILLSKITPKYSTLFSNGIFRPTEVELMLWPTVSRPIRLGVGHPHDQIFLFPFFCRTIALFLVLGRPLWREDGSVICSAICQWSESRRTHNHTLLSHLRLLHSFSIASYDPQGLRRKSCYDWRSVSQ
jgi:hypothetical protein